MVSSMQLFPLRYSPLISSRIAPSGSLKQTIGHIETPSPYTPLGIKGMGEGGAIAPPAAIANAVADALAPLGARINEIPLTPERVLECIERARIRLRA